MRSSILVFAILLAACSDPDPSDAPDSSSLDATVPVDATPDARPPEDSGSMDAFASADTSVPDDTSVPGDTGVPDTGVEDSGEIAPGQCSSECTPTCIRPYRCVTVCGGPETACGCCACAEGSIDTIDC